MQEKKRQVINVLACCVGNRSVLLPLASIIINWPGELSCMNFGELTSRDGFESRGITQAIERLACINRHLLDLLE